MFHNRKLNNKINRFHEKGLRINYNYVSVFKTLLEVDCLVTIQQRNLQLLMEKINKTKSNLISNHMKQPYNLRYSDKLRLPNVNNLAMNRYSQIYGEKVCETLALELKNAVTLTSFKRHIKTYKCKTCSCRLCKIFCSGLAF